MKKFLCFLLGGLLAVSAAACAGADPEDGMDIPTVVTKLATLDKEAEGGVIQDSMGNPTFASGNTQATVWGVENDQWNALDTSRSKFDDYIESSLYINANTIAVHMPWNVLEPSEGVYATGENSYLQYCVDAAREAGLKIVVYFTSTNYASGDGSFIPDYIRNDTEKYQRLYLCNEKGELVYDSSTETVDSEMTMCISDPDLIEREKLAVAELFRFLEKNNSDGIITAVNLCSEVDYSRSWAGNDLYIQYDKRCACENCNALYRQGEGNEDETPYEFMLRTYLNYIKTIVDAAAETYADVALYTPVAALTWFAGGRYVEQPDLIKAAVNRENHFVCPSIAPTASYALYEQEMAYFKPDVIPGNASFSSGIGTGTSDNQKHLEVAPWYSILNDGGLGAIYWDYPLSGADGQTGSVLNIGNAISVRLRTGWAPLKAADYYISRFKGDTEVLNWWSYEEHQKEFSLGTFTVSVNRNEEDWDEHENYGIAVLHDKKDLRIAATDYQPAIGENNEIHVTRAGGFDGFTFEVGYVNLAGEWVKTGTFSPSISGDTLTFTPDNGGDYMKAMYRIYKA